MNKTQKIDGVRLLHGIAALSFIGIVGIFACCVESINEGGTGLTATLFFVVYVLLLLGCNAELVASEESFNRVFSRTKKLYDLVKSKTSVEGIDLYNIEFDKKCKNVIFAIIGLLSVAMWLVVHFTLIRSLILALLISIGLFYMVLTLAMVAWNLEAIRRLNKTRKKLEK
mgnify:CR=1 FL=1